MPPLLQTAANAAARAFGFMRNSLSRIYDSFARVTSGSLGTTTSGSIWNAITGVWNAASGVATTATSPSSYPSATIPVAVNASASVVSPSPGAGVMLWEAGSGDWWGATSYVSEASVNTYNCVSNSCCTTYSTCASNGCCTTANYSQSYATPATCPGTYTAPGNTIACAFSSQISGGGLLTCYYNGCCVNNGCCTGSPTGGCNSNSCCSTTLAYTTYTWSHFVQILKSVASVISSVGMSALLGTNSNTSGTYPGSVVNSLMVTTLGTTIEAFAYSDTGFATLLGTLSETNGVTPTGIGVGILLAPSPAAQGSTVGPFTAT